MDKLKLIFKLVTLVFWTILLPVVVGLYLWTCRREELYSVGVVIALGLLTLWLMYYVKLLVAGIKEARK